MFYHIRSTIQLGTQMGTRPQKVPTASTFFSVVATCFPGVPGKLRADLGSSHDSKTFGLFSLSGTNKTFRVVKGTLAHAPCTYRPRRRTRCVGIFVFNIENPNMFAGKSTLYIGDVWVLHPQKSPLPALFFQW